MNTVQDDVRLVRRSIDQVSPQHGQDDQSVDGPAYMTGHPLRLDSLLTGQKQDSDASYGPVRY